MLRQAGAAPVDTPTSRLRPGPGCSSKRSPRRGRHTTYDRSVEPHEDNVVTVEMMVGGFEHAVTRLEEASSGVDKDATFRPLFEALNWAVAVDERVGGIWAPDGKPLGIGWRSRVTDASVMAGLRFARNRVHHNWADALELRDGFTFPLRFPIAFVTWEWRDLADLPRDRPDAPGEEIYKDQLEGRPALDSLNRLQKAFGLVLPRLEPPRPD